MIAPENIGIELIIIERANGKEKIQEKIDLKLEKIENRIATYSIDVRPAKPGIYKYAFRLYPKHELLPHRQDFPVLMWI
jgi:phosphorylase/glycogen(starch) synthase